MEQIDFVKGILIGGCVGSVISLLLAPKSGKDLRHDIVDGYNAINNQSHEYAEEIRDQAQCFVDTMHKKEHENHALILGSISGALIGTLAAMLLAPQSGTKLRRHLGEKYEEIREKAEEAVNDIQNASEEKLEDWKDTFMTIIDKLSVAKQKKSLRNAPGGQYLRDIADWAALGLRLYSQLQERR